MALPAGVLVTSVMFVYNWNVYILVSKHLITVLFFYFFIFFYTIQKLGASGTTLADTK